MTKAEMVEDIINILEELNIIRVTDSPKNRPKPSANLPENHCELSCIAGNAQTSKAPEPRPH